ncbi:hypothetical protein GCM10010441_32690 [Kitasatospora paracochleata]|uniref:SUKH-4 immunity protein of toxin-antitoxin system n=1 Tax=Kitasatospora paracochleata TaxID=58354 RepID=A0ABT1IPQ8_9ACTN|nr:SUKH-4 family immunity protein [Kitasatospora paracochleata]MCP2307118.1 hypothetical protein [Kitasatospora paracochleata]
MLVQIDWSVVSGEHVPAGGMLRLRKEAAARIWSDEDAARFAVEVGVPHSNGLFRIVAELAERDPASPDWAFVEPYEGGRVDTPHGPLQQLGEVYQSLVYVHLGDGTVWISDPDSEVEYELVHRDLSSFAYLVYKIAAEKPRPEEDPDPFDWADAEEIIREDTTAWDPLPFESGAHFWEMYLESYPML